MLIAKLAKIQKELKAPKNQKNTFGNYNYRSCEDIVEAVKPLLGDAALVLTDELIQLGDRYYVKATAALYEGDASISANGYARESLEKKGMDASQITGASSSYARKYALNGLFAIDDTKDADSDEKPQETKKVAQQPERKVVKNSSMGKCSICYAPEGKPHANSCAKRGDE